MGPVVADGDAGSSGNLLGKGGLANAFRFSGLLIVCWSGPRRSLGPGRSPSCGSPGGIFFLTVDCPVTVLTLSGRATTAASKGVWEAGTLGFTSSEIIAISVESCQLVCIFVVVSSQILRLMKETCLYRWSYWSKLIEFYLAGPM